MEFKITIEGFFTSETIETIDQQKKMLLECSWNALRMHWVPKKDVA